MIPGAHVFVAGGVSNAPLNARELGITAFQIFSRNQNQWNAKPLDETEIKKYLENCTECGITTTLAHASYLINLCSTDKLKSEKSKNAFIDEMNRADQLEIPYLVIHPGSHLGAGEEAGIRQVGRALNELLHRHKDGKVVILLETTAGQGTNLGHSFEQLAHMINLTENPDRLGVCLDTCHIFAAGYDFRTIQDYRLMMLKFDHSIGLHNLRAIHFNDSIRGCGSRIDRHASIGEGEIGIEPFRFFLEDDRLAEVPFILETPGGMDGYRRNLKILSDLIA